MRIGKAIIENFKGISKIETSLNNGVIYVCGKNESGKSSFLDGLMFALLGKKAFPKGKWKEIVSTADGKTLVGCNLIDNDGNVVVEIKRKITGPGSESLTAKRKDGKSFTQKDLDAILEPISLNPKAFMDMSPQEQAIFLGIDTSDIDAEYKEVYQERQFIGRDVKRLKGAMEEAECEKPDGVIDVQEANDKYHDALRNNEIINGSIANIEEIEIRIRDHERIIEELKSEINAEKEKIAGKEIIDLEPLVKQVEDANSHKDRLQSYNLYINSSKEYDKVKEQYDRYTEKLTEIKERKAEKIKATKLPFNNLTTDDSGGLMVRKNGKLMPFNSDFFSTGKLWEMTVKLLSKKDDDLKLVIIKEATLLDEDKLNHIAEVAKSKGLQILLEYVGESQDSNSITLVEGKLDES